MFHINKQGKVYQCRAKVRKCPHKYHAKTRAELYRLLEKEGFYINDYSENFVKYIKEVGPIDNIYESPLGREWPHHFGMLEYLSNTLNHTLDYLETDGWEDHVSMKRPYPINVMEDRIYWNVYNAYKNGIPYVDKYVPYLHKSPVHDKALEDCRKKHNLYKAQYYADPHSKKNFLPVLELIDLEEDHKKVVEWLKTRKTKEQYNDFVERMRYLKEKMDNLINAKKLLYRPTFDANTPDEILNTISNMDDDSLLSLYEDYNVDKIDFELAMRQVNDFQDNYWDNKEFSYRMKEYMAFYFKQCRNVLEVRRAQSDVDNMFILFACMKEMEKRDILFGDLLPKERRFG